MKLRRASLLTSGERYNKRGRRIPNLRVLPVEPFQWAMKVRFRSTWDLRRDNPSLCRLFEWSKAGGGLTYYGADELANWLGLHPFDIWGSDFFGEAS